MRVVLHESSKKYSSIQHIDELALHFVIYLAVTGESSATVSMAGQPKPVLTLMSMKSIEQVLSDQGFMRVHRSYIVNTARISIIKRNTICIADHVVPVSDTYRDQFNAYVASLNPDDSN